MKYKKGRKLWKYYRDGYNNPGHYDSSKLLNNNTDEDAAQAVIAGMCQRATDNQQGSVRFKS